jgi:inosine-uridine nucleoside N-ribohydrolase
MDAKTPAILFDTDMGNDIDDALTLLVAIRAEDAGKARLLAVLSSNPSEWSVPGTQAILAYCGMKERPVGASTEKIGLGLEAYTRTIAEASGYKPQTATDAVKLMRMALAARPEKSVRIVATGFSTNLAGLLASKPNYQEDHLPLSGLDLVKSKVEFLSIMAGNYEDPEMGEFNVAQNVPAFRRVIEEWPTPIYLSGFEIGSQVFSRWDYLQKSLLPANLVRKAYETYFTQSKEEKWDRPSWDQTAMLQAIEPEAGHFDLSEPVSIEVTDKGQTRVKGSGDPNVPPRRYLKFSEANPPEKIERLLEEWYK